MKLEQETFNLTWEDLHDLKSICKEVLELNIAVKTFQGKHTSKEQFKKMSQESIENSKKGLILLDNIENGETINDLIRRGVGDREWAFFISVLSVFSGSLADPKFYEFDKKITADKKKEMN